MATLEADIQKVEACVNRLVKSGNSHNKLKLVTAVLVQYMAAEGVEGFDMKFDTTEGERVAVSVNIEVAE